MSRTLGRPVSAQVGWVYLVRLDGKWLKPRPRHVLADRAQQAAFKKSDVLADSTAHEQGYTEHGGSPHRTGLLL